MKYYLFKMRTEKFNDIFEGSSFASVVNTSKVEVRKQAKRFIKYMEVNHPEDNRKYDIYTMEFKKVK